MMRRLSEEMARAFGSTLWLSRDLGQAGVWAPPIEVLEEDNRVEVRAELAGLTKDDVKVECTDEGVVIEGEKRREEQKKEGAIYRSERSYGRFHRLVPLPDGAEPEKAKAEFKNGVLQVSIPISEAKRQTKRIPISG
jgi:HSP20 family protein